MKAKRPGDGDGAAERARRSAEALRANLHRRKAQERQRSDTPPTDAPAAPEAPETTPSPSRPDRP